ncbi:MAG: 1-deoxy-D-xylulose-5-phosphate synthase, partial [candidate division WOR-3 bacterium]|nr:1-deoxy-D-xylulose-5-phosphate synthase [candidate division WOR-3 bacterium]
PVSLGKAEVVREGEQGCVLAVGYMACVADRAADILKDRGMNVTLVNVRFVKPMDRRLILSLADRYHTIVTIEENVLNGGFGAAVRGLVEQEGRTTRVTSIGLEDRFYEQGPRNWLLEQAGLSPEKLADRIKAEVQRTKD